MALWVPAIRVKAHEFREGCMHNNVLALYPAGYAGKSNAEVRQGAEALRLFLLGNPGCFAGASKVSFDVEGAHVHLHYGDFGPESAGLLYEREEMLLLVEEDWKKAEEFRRQNS